MPAGIRLGVGSAAMVAATILTAILTDPGTPQRLLVMAVAAGLAVAMIPDWRYGLLLALIGYLLYVGFLVNSYGELNWHGRHISWEVAIFAFAAWIGLLSRWLRAKAPSRLGGRP
jgi:hypothetical protein